MTRSATRLDRLARTFHERPQPLTDAERLAEKISGMTTAERVARIAELEAEAVALCGDLDPSALFVDVPMADKLDTEDEES